MQKSKKRGKRGFTLLEMVFALAVVSVLAMVALPSLAAMRKNMVMSRLDQKAEELYLYAQNRISYLRAYGSPTPSNGVITSSDSAVFAEEIDGKSAVLIVDRDSQNAESLYFSEKLSAEELEKLCADGLDEAERRRLEIGFYGGDGASAAPREHVLRPKIKALNGDDMTLEITCDGLEGALSDEVTVELKISSDDGLSMSCFGSSDFNRDFDSITLVDGTLTATLTVDSLNTDKAYMKKLGTIFGVQDSLTATAKIICSAPNRSEPTSEHAQEVCTVSFCPLFGEKNGPNVSVANLRHLSNIRVIDTHGVAVSQTENINCIENFSPLPCFFGSYDGGGFFVNDLNICTCKDSVGLFSELSGSVENLGLRGGSVLSTSEESAAVGAFCGRAHAGSEIKNCSAVGLTVGHDSSSADGVSSSSADGVSSSSADCVSVGGLVGEAGGAIVSCRSEADRIFDDSASARDVCLGGIGGKLTGGEVSLSRCSGRLETRSEAENITVGGLVSGGGGRLENCSTECSAGYIGGGEYFGLGRTPSDGCKFLAENGWLSEDRLGETPAETLGGKLANPRGLIGAARAEYSGGKFSSTLLASFDAFSNDSKIIPEIGWESPSEGEVRYYFFSERTACPAEGEIGGWSIENSEVNIGSDEARGRFFCAV